MKSKFIKSLLTIGILSIGVSACNFLPNTVRNRSENNKSESINKVDPWAPVVNKANNTVTYGIYPQTVIDDQILEADLERSASLQDDGWYLYENEYYAKVITGSQNFDRYEYCFDNGTRFHNGETYWFKCEPIVWNVLDHTGNEYYLLSSVLLDVSIYHESESYYYSSYIREWLNNEFFNNAFVNHNSAVLTTPVDNSTDNSFGSQDSLDKVFLPSLADYMNPNYGFENTKEKSETRYCSTTDYSRARGGLIGYYQSNSSDYNDAWHNNGFYWTRTPANSSSVYAVMATGSNIWNDPLTIKDDCVRPAIRIAL